MLRASSRCLRVACALPAPSGWSAWLRGVKVQANDLRSGAVYEDKDGRLLEVLRFEHTHGQGRASGFVQLEARDLRSGAKRVERLRPSDAVERVQLDEQSYTFLFAEGRSITAMHPTSFEQARAMHGLSLSFSHCLF